MVHIATSTTPEFRSIREQLRRLRVRLGTLRAEHEAAHPEWRRGVDARLTGFGKLANIVESAELALKFLDEELSTTAWWERVYGRLPCAQDMSIYIRGSSANSPKADSVQMGFGSIESTLRIFLRAIDPGACLGGTSEFKSVYECLFRTKIVALTPALPLLDLLRMMRNTIHNNGFHFHRKRQDGSVEYKGVVRQFPIGRPIDFATWALIIELLEDAVDMLDAAVNSPEIGGIGGEILDPFAS